MNLLSFQISYNSERSVSGMNEMSDRIARVALQPNEANRGVNFPDFSKQIKPELPKQRSKYADYMKNYMRDYRAKQKQKQEENRHVC